MSSSPCARRAEVSEQSVTFRRQRTQRTLFDIVMAKLYVLPLAKKVSQAREGSSTTADEDQKYSLGVMGNAVASAAGFVDSSTIVCSSPIAGTRQPAPSRDKPAQYVAASAQV